MDALTALRTKRDTRSYVDQALPADVLERLLDAARMAGSAKNSQPVRVIVVTDNDTKVSLKDSGDYATWIDTAPAVLVFTVTADAGPRRLFDVGRHCQNLMVAAQAEGLASCPVTIHHQDVARNVLNVPDDVEPVMIVTVGSPGPTLGPSPVAGPRVPLSNYAFTGAWGQA